MTAPPATDDRRTALSAARWLRGGVAFVWLWTGLAVLHPYYREMGMTYLAPLGLPPAVMYATCAGEVLLGLRVAFGRAATWVTALQIAMIAGFTTILTVAQPTLWLDPLGMLTKNLPLVVMLVAAWLLERERWTRRADHLLRFGLALFWALNGVLLLAGESHWLWPAWEIGLGVLIVFTARALPLSLLGAVVLLVMGTVAQPLHWFHPFGPLTKVVALAVASAVATNRLVPLRGWRVPQSLR